MDKIKAARKEIDLIDEKILDLLSKRAELALGLGRQKVIQNLPIQNLEREKQILSNLESLNKGRLSHVAIRQIYEKVFEVFRQLQKQNSSDTNSPSLLEGKTIGILGLGLMGGSLAKAILNHMPSKKISVFDVKSSQPLHSNIHFVSNPSELVVCDIIVLASTLDANQSFLVQMDDKLSDSQIVFDLGSTKRAIHRAYSLLKNKRFSFVGGHPLVGSHLSGFENSRGDLYEGSNFVLTSGREDVPKEVLELIQLIGATPSYMGIDEHDNKLALSSHWPHLLSIVLAEMAQSTGLDKTPQAVPRSFMEFLRLANSNEKIWLNIFSHNKSEILEIGKSLILKIETLMNLIEEDKSSLMSGKFKIAKKIYENITKANNRLGDSDYDNRTKATKQQKTVA